ncbi:hypothetical protein [Niabella sp.]|uniref:hypothetical protein n=1 Tax=Niabella sp. TaxID=1962976 RepID=UPI00261B887F|nr:hypothetical protein [Niabella sp.]
MNYPEQDQTPSFIPLDVYTKSKISSTAKVAGTAAILSISGTIISLVAYITKPAVRTGLAKEGFDDATLQVTTKGPVLFVALSVLVSAVLFYMLYRFSKHVQKGLGTDNRHALNKGLSYLATYFKIIGILLLCSLAFLFLSTLVMGLGATA